MVYITFDAVGAFGLAFYLLFKSCLSILCVIMILDLSFCNETPCTPSYHKNQLLKSLGVSTLLPSFTLFDIQVFYFINRPPTPNILGEVYLLVTTNQFTLLVLIDFCPVQSKFLNFQFCFLEHLISYQKLLWNIRSTLRCQLNEQGGYFK